MNPSNPTHRSERTSTQRFSNRVEDYVRYRPRYPEAIVRALEREAGLTPESIVADIGSGTGFSAEIFLDYGCTVYAVEPNAEMRAAAERGLGTHPGFRSVGGTAEATTLTPESVDLVTAGQAFHWFDPTAARREFARILRPGGCVALFWNHRLTDGSPFLRDYEALLRKHGTDYAEVQHRNIADEQLFAFFGEPYRKHTSPNSQEFDFEGLKGRLLSSSYVPAAGDPRHEPMLQELRRIFDAHQHEGRVSLLYDTELYVGGIT